MLEMRSSKQSLGNNQTSMFGRSLALGSRQLATDATQTSLMEPSRTSQGFQTGEELSDREKQILFYCEQQQDKLKRALNKTYKEGKSIGKIEETQRRLKKLMPAKLALA